MGQIDERLRRDLERVAEPADPAGVADRALRRADRRRSRRRAQTAFITLVVVAGSIGGVLALARVFRTDGGTFPGVVPVPIQLHTNGRIAFAFSARDGIHLETIQPDGSDPTVIPTPDGLPWLPAWSPDGGRLAVAIFPLSGGPRAIWVMDADGANPVRIAEADNVSQPAWSPDGQWILYTAEANHTSAIHIVRPDGSGDRILNQIPAPGTRAIFSAAFSPDSTQILFDQGTDSGMDVYLMQADGSDAHPITSTGQDYDPHWSPDGTRIAFTRQGTGDQSDIYVMDADGSNVVQLTRAGEGETDLYPTWSPDGTQIAFLAGKNGGPGDLVVMNTDGSHPSTLVSGGPSTGVLGISWQPLSEGASPTASMIRCVQAKTSGDFDGDGAVDHAEFVEVASLGVSCEQGGEVFKNLSSQELVIRFGSGRPLEEPFTDCQGGLCAYVFEATDLDGDGRDELAIDVSSAAATGLVEFYRVNPNGIRPLVISEPGDPPYVEPGQAILGGGFDSGTQSPISCRVAADGTRELVSIHSTNVGDSLLGPWKVHTTTMTLRDDRLVVGSTGDSERSLSKTSEVFHEVFQSECP